MIKKRIIITLTFLDGVLFRTKKFIPDYRYTKNFINFWNIDELILIDISEKKFDKKFLEVIKFFSENCFVPISVGGGIKDIENADLLFKIGADKILLGFESYKNPSFLENLSKKYGNQSIIQAVDLKRKGVGYTIMTNSGQKETNIDPIEFCQKVQSIGIGEILINCVDNDGGLLGYDLKAIELLNDIIKCPKLVLGGCGNWEHMEECFVNYDISGVCTQNIFHFTNESIVSAKNYLMERKIFIRK